MLPVTLSQPVHVVRAFGALQPLSRRAPVQTEDPAKEVPEAQTLWERCYRRRMNTPPKATNEHSKAEWLEMSPEKDPAEWQDKWEDWAQDWCQPQSSPVQSGLDQVSEAWA